MKYAKVGLVLLLAFSEGQSEENGIGVGRPKVFDNRSLTIMLQQLNDQLRTVQVVDQTKLAASLGLMQGFQSRDTAQSLSVATPFTTTKQTFDAKNNPTGTEKDTTPGGSGAAPALPDLQADPSGFAPQYGINSEDLLADQVNLSYRIFNLRMLLERSLTDRLWPASDGTHAAPRLQAIIGFNVSVTPPKFAKGKAAVVEITIIPRNYGTGPVSLVAMMPLEKTYNSAALSKSATAFGGSAVAKIVTIGYSYRRRGEKLYLFRDADTIAFERTNAHATESSQASGEVNLEPRAITCGWEFRPVLGRESVSPGERQMFAVVAFPAGDPSALNLVAHPRVGFPFDVKVRTYWKKYYRDKLTTKLEVTALDSKDFPGGRAPYTSESQYDLAPKINHVRWAATGPDTAVVTVDGENFFPGTSVVLGNQTYSTPSDGLILKSDQSFQLNTTIAAIASGEVFLNGRYGPSRIISPDSQLAPGISILRFDLTPNPARLLWPLNLTIRAGSDAPLTLVEVRSSVHSEPIISVAGKPIPGPYHYQQVNCDLPQPGGNMIHSTCVLVQALVPADLAKSEASIGIRFPLLGSEWADSRLYYNPSQVLKVVRVGGGARTTLAISGELIDPTATVQLDHLYKVRQGELVLVGPTLLTLAVDTAVLAQFKTLIVRPTEHATPSVLEVPPPKPEAPKAKLDDNQHPSATVGSAPAVTFTGSGLGAITSVSFEHEHLPFKAGDDAKSIQIFLSRRVTATDGTVQILLTSADGSIVPASIVVNPKVATANKPNQ
jgi:hypothetical protein